MMSEGSTKKALGAGIVITLAACGGSQGGGTGGASSTTTGTGGGAGSTSSSTASSSTSTSTSSSSTSASSSSTSASSSGTGGMAGCELSDPASCEDGNPCTNDTCGGDGQCAHTHAAAGTVCVGGTCDGNGACVAAAGGSALWIKVYPLSDAQPAGSSLSLGAIAADASGDAVFAGSLHGTLSVPPKQIMVGQTTGELGFYAVIDGNGTGLRADAYQDGSSTVAKAAAFDGAGNVFLGSDATHQGAEPTVTVRKYAPLGQLVFETSYGFVGQQQGEYLYGIAVGGTGEVFALHNAYYGSIEYGPSSTLSGQVLSKQDAAGAKLWGKTIGSVGGALLPSAAGGVFYTSAAGLVKTDASGSTVLTKAYGSGAQLAAGPSGTVLIAQGFSGSVDFGGGPLTSGAGKSLAIAKVDESGNHIFSKSFSMTLGSSLSACSDAAGDLIVSGDFTGTADFGGGPITGTRFVVKLDASGGHLWSRAFASGSFVMACTPQGAVFLASVDPSLDFGGGPPLAATKGVVVAKLAP
ncbi:5'-nucleotidase [Minicystis rosea]|nr:5'-nucleotidase [Minicystis rosea]